MTSFSARGFKPFQQTRRFLPEFIQVDLPARTRLAIDFFSVGVQVITGGQQFAMPDDGCLWIQRQFQANPGREGGGGGSGLPVAR